MGLTTPTTQELREFYPVSKSITDERRDDLFTSVENILFVKMFGYEAAKKISEGIVPNSDSESFIGFRKFSALCCAYQEVKDPFIATNFGLKVIDRQGARNPTNNEKGITVIPLEEIIQIHYKIALKLVGTFNCQGVPNWGGYYSYTIKRL